MDNKFKNPSIVERISINAMIASIYFILTMATLPVSFYGMQIRIAEILILLCFFRKDFVLGVTIGTLLANINSPMGAWDMLFGTLATLISGLLIGYMRHLFLAALIPVVINAFVVGFELHLILGLPLWINVGLVGLGEMIAVGILGYFIFLLLGKNEKFQEIIGANQNYRFKW
ncbi:MAG: QueT transporter family protein [Sphingobacteriia bacterium]|nr:QueT transporter family protein [Sphingobacteriia bacterium]